MTQRSFPFRRTPQIPQSSWMTPSRHQSTSIYPVFRPTTFEEWPRPERKTHFSTGQVEESFYPWGHKSQQETQSWFKISLLLFMVLFPQMSVFTGIKQAFSAMHVTKRDKKKMVCIKSKWQMETWTEELFSFSGPISNFLSLSFQISTFPVNL